jgi:hypothetical protein
MAKIRKDIGDTLFAEFDTSTSEIIISKVPVNRGILTIHLSQYELRELYDFNAVALAVEEDVPF